MRKNISFSCCVIGLLLLAPPAFALSYSGFSMLDLTTLTFSNSSIDPTSDTRSISQHQSISDPLTFCCIPQQNFRSDSWVSHTLTLSRPEIGTGVSIIDSNAMYASSVLTGLGSLASSALRSSSFVVPITGYLTVSVGYSLGQGGVIDTTAPPQLIAAQSAVLSFRHTDSSVLSTSRADITTAGSVLGDTSKTGFLSLTQWFDAGHIAELNLAVLSFATHDVPEPNMFWPTLVGIIGIAGIAQRRA